MNANVFCNAVEDKLQRKLAIDERDSIKSYLQQITIESHTSLKLAFKYHLEQVLRVLRARAVNISDSLEDIKAQQIAMLGKRDEDFQLVEKKHTHAPDERELLAAETAKLEALFLLEVGEVYDLSKAIAPKSKLKYSYLMLDSNNCIEIPDTRDKFMWLLQEEHPVLQTGYINLHSKLRNIVMARLGRMTMAHMHGDFAAAAVARNRFAFGFDEFASQALITPSGTKFQFIEFLPEYDTNYGTTIVLSPFNANRGWFRFRERFKMLDKLTLSITNLFDDTKVQVPATPFSFPASQISGILVSSGGSFANNPVSIPNHSLYLPINYYYGQAGYEYDVYAMVQGEYIFSGYNSGIPAIDAVWNAGTHQLQWRAIGGFYYEVPLLARPPPFAVTDFTITLTELPRFTGVLELISEDDSDDDTPI